MATSIIIHNNKNETKIQKVRLVENIAAVGTNVKHDKNSLIRRYAEFVGLFCLLFGIFV